MATVKKVTKTQKGKTATVGKTRKSKTSAKANTDKKNIKNTVEQVVESKREIKYKYPEDMNDTVIRKKFRQKVRNQIRKYERELNDLSGREKIKLNTEYKKYRKEVLLVP